jgi:hypothetical protein
MVQGAKVSIGATQVKTTFNGALWVATLPAPTGPTYSVSAVVEDQPGAVLFAIGIISTTNGQAVKVVAQNCSGGPVAGVVVRVMWQGAILADNGLASGAVTDANGEAIAFLEDGTYNLILRMDDYKDLRIQSVIIANDLTDFDAAGAVLEQHVVLDSAGAPVVGARVRILNPVLTPIEDTLIAVRTTNGTGEWTANLAAATLYRYVIGIDGKDAAVLSVETIGCGGGSDESISGEALDQIALYTKGTVHPPVPGTLVAIYTCLPNKTNTKAVKLTWTAPANAPDVVSYAIYRNDVQVDEVLAPTTEYYDVIGSGDLNYATYYVVAKDSLGQEGALTEGITNFTLTVNTYIDTLRRSLKDNPLDPRVRRWTDEDLLLYLTQALSDLNVTPVQTSFTLETLPKNMFNLLLTGARIAAHDSQSGLEIAKEFNMGVGGLSMTIDRSAKYVSLSTAERTAYDKQRDRVKLNMVMSMVHGEGILSSDLPFKIRTFAPRQYRVR